MNGIDVVVGGVVGQLGLVGDQGVQARAGGQGGRDVQGVDGAPGRGYERDRGVEEPVCDSDKVQARQDTLGVLGGVGVDGCGGTHYFGAAKGTGEPCRASVEA